MLSIVVADIEVDDDVEIPASFVSPLIFIEVHQSSD